MAIHDPNHSDVKGHTGGLSHNDDLTIILEVSLHGMSWLYQGCVVLKMILS